MPTKIPPEQKTQTPLINPDHNRKKKKKKLQINPNQNPDIAATAATTAARSTFPPLLINPDQPIIGENHSITTGKKKKADQRFLHCDV